MAFPHWAWTNQFYHDCLRFGGCFPVQHCGKGNNYQGRLLLLSFSIFSFSVIPYRPSTRWYHAVDGRADQPVPEKFGSILGLVARPFYHQMKTPATGCGCSRLCTPSSDCYAQRLIAFPDPIPRWHLMVDHQALAT